MLYIGYEYESANGCTITKLVTCKTEEEYRRVKFKIEDAGLKPIEFAQVRSSSTI